VPRTCPSWMSNRNGCLILRLHFAFARKSPFRTSLVARAGSSYSPVPAPRQPTIPVSSRAACPGLPFVCPRICVQRHEICMRFSWRPIVAPIPLARDLLLNSIDHDESLPLRSLSATRLFREYGVRELRQHARVPAGSGSHGVAGTHGRWRMAIAAAQAGRTALPPLRQLHAGERLQLGRSRLRPASSLSILSSDTDHPET